MLTVPGFSKPRLIPRAISLSKAETSEPVSNEFSVTASTSGYGPFQRPVWGPCFMHCKPPATSSPHSKTNSAGRTLPSSARSSNHTASQPTDGLASVTRCKENARCSRLVGLTRCFKGRPCLSFVDDAMNSVIGYQASPLWAAGLVLRRGGQGGA